MDMWVGYYAAYSAGQKVAVPGGLCGRGSSEVGGDQAREVQNALYLKMSQFEVWRPKCIASMVIERVGKANKDSKMKEINYNRIVNLLLFTLMEENTKV